MQEDFPGKSAYLETFLIRYGSRELYARGFPGKSAYLETFLIRYGSVSFDRDQ